MTIIAYFVVGLQAGGRVTIGTTYMNELLPRKYQNFATSLLSVFDASVMLFQVGFYSLNKSWAPLHAFGITGAAIITYLVYLLPESPKYLYANYRFDECR